MVITKVKSFIALALVVIFATLHFFGNVPKCLISRVFVIVKPFKPDLT
jgi:hypothetical protein